VASSWFLFFSYHNDAARSNKNQTALLVCPLCALQEFLVLEKAYGPPPPLFPVVLLPAFNTVASCSVLVIRASFLSVRTWTITSSILPNANFLVFKWSTGRLRVVGQKEGRLLGLVLPRCLVFRCVRKIAKSDY